MGIAHERIKEFMKTYENEVWDMHSDMPKMGDKLKELLIQYAPEIFAATFGNMFQTAVNSIKRSY